MEQSNNVDPPKALQIPNINQIHHKKTQRMQVRRLFEISDFSGKGLPDETKDHLFLKNIRSHWWKE